MSELEALKHLVGREVGLSDWIKITQKNIDVHAENTDDNLWIHTDPQRAAAETPFGGTIVPGTLVLSHLTNMARSISLPVENIKYRLGYGFNRVRMVQPVPVDSRIRGRFELNHAEAKGHHGIVVHVDTSIEIEGDDIAPAVVAEWMIYLRLAD